MRSTVFGKPPQTPIIPRHIMDLYEWRDPLLYNKICSEQSIFNFDVHLRNVQMLRQLEPSAFDSFKLRSRYFFYDYGAFIYSGRRRKRRSFSRFLALLGKRFGWSRSSGGVNPMALFRPSGVLDPDHIDCGEGRGAAGDQELNYNYMSVENNM